MSILSPRPWRRCRCSPFAHKETEERLKSLPKVTEVAEMLSEARAVWLKHLHSSLYSWPNLAQIRLLGTQGWHVSMCAWPKGPNLEPRDHFYNLCILLVEISPPQRPEHKHPTQGHLHWGQLPLGAICTQQKSWPFRGHTAKLQPRGSIRETRTSPAGSEHFR